MGEKEMKAKVTISRRTNTVGSGCIAISIDDDKSGLKVVEVEMELIDFAQAITGLSYCKAAYRNSQSQYTIDNIMKKREVKSVYVDKPNVFDKDEMKRIVIKSVLDSGVLVDGWEIHNDGCSSQQNGKLHNVSLLRFV